MRSLEILLHDSIFCLHVKEKKTNVFSLMGFEFRGRIR